MEEKVPYTIPNRESILTVSAQPARKDNCSLGNVLQKPILRHLPAAIFHDQHFHTELIPHPSGFKRELRFRAVLKRLF